MKPLLLLVLLFPLTLMANPPVQSKPNSTPECQSPGCDAKPGQFETEESLKRYGDHVTAYSLGVHSEFDLSNVKPPLVINRGQSCSRTLESKTVQCELCLANRFSENLNADKALEFSGKFIMTMTSYLSNGLEVLGRSTTMTSDKETTNHGLSLRCTIIGERKKEDWKLSAYIRELKELGIGVRPTKVQKGQNSTDDDNAGRAGSSAKINHSKKNREPSSK